MDWGEPPKGLKVRILPVPAWIHKRRRIADPSTATRVTAYLRPIQSWDPPGSSAHGKYPPVTRRVAAYPLSSG